MFDKLLTAAVVALMALAFLSVGPDETSLESACRAHAPTDRACQRF